VGRAVCQPAVKAAAARISVTKSFAAAATASPPLLVQEHDFGAFDADRHRVFFKIDYFDESLSYHSPDPADPSVTKRVITIMLAEEY
jgi:Protein of unknown function (DUF3768)